MGLDSELRDCGGFFPSREKRMSWRKLTHVRGGPSRSTCSEGPGAYGTCVIPAACTSEAELHAGLFRAKFWSDGMSSVPPPYFPFSQL